MKSREQKIVDNIIKIELLKKEIKDLNLERGLLFSKCSKGSFEGEVVEGFFNELDHCAIYAFKEAKRFSEENMPYDGVDWIDVFNEHACDSCKEAYRLKQIRNKLSSRIGSSRSAITRMARIMIEQQRSG